MKYIKKLIEFLTPSWEFHVRQAMYFDGYSDIEIDMHIEAIKS